MSGKGRGRGWLKIEKTQNNEVRPGELRSPPEVSSPVTYSVPSTPINSQCDKIVHAITHFNDNDDGILINQKFQYVKDVFVDACQNCDDVKLNMEYAFNRALSDSSFTSKFSLFVSLNTFRTITICNKMLRAIFLQLLQHTYDNVKNMYTNTPHHFPNFVKLLCGFYEKSIMSSSRNYYMLITPILECFSMLLNSDAQEDIELFTTQLYACGPKFVEDGINLNDLAIKIRTILSSNSRTLSESSKLWLLLAMDLMNNEFRVFSTDLLNFYQMKLGRQDLFSFKKPLMVECASANNKLNEYSSDVNVLEIDTNLTKLQMNNSDNKTPKSPNPTENNEMLWNGNKNNQAPTNNYRPKLNASAGRPILGAGARTNSNKNQSHIDNTGTSNWRNHKETSPNGPGNNSRKPRKGWEHDDRFETDYN